MINFTRRRDENEMGEGGGGGRRSNETSLTQPDDTNIPFEFEFQPAKTIGSSLRFAREILQGDTRTCKMCIDKISPLEFHSRLFSIVFSIPPPLVFLFLLFFLFAARVKKKAGNDEMYEKLLTNSSVSGGGIRGNLVGEES